MKPARFLAACVSSVPCSARGASASPAARTDPGASSALSVVRVATNRPPRDAERLATAGFDLLEARVGIDLLVVGDSTTAAKLSSLGYRVSVHAALPDVSLTTRTTNLVTSLATCLCSRSGRTRATRRSAG